jgi:hypothetical protein
METSGLLESKPYGLGKEKLWYISAHAIENPKTGKKITKKQNEKVLSELGFKSIVWEVHGNMVEHDIDLTDIFVSLALTDSLYEWQGEGTGELTHDRMFRVCPCIYYLERERSKKGAERLREKIKRYIKYYAATGRPFNVLFTVDTDPEIEQLDKLFAEFGLGNSYQIVLHHQFVADPFNALISTRFKDFTLAQHVENCLQTRLQ